MNPEPVLPADAVRSPLELALEMHQIQFQRANRLENKIARLEALLDDAFNGCSPEWISEQRALIDGTNSPAGGRVDNHGESDPEPIGGRSGKAVGPQQGTQDDGLATGGVISKEAAQEIGRSIGRHSCVIEPPAQDDGQADGE